MAAVPEWLLKPPSKRTESNVLKIALNLPINLMMLMHENSNNYTFLFLILMPLKLN